MFKNVQKNHKNDLSIDHLFRGPWAWKNLFTTSWALSYPFGGGFPAIPCFDTLPKLEYMSELLEFIFSLVTGLIPHIYWLTNLFHLLKKSNVISTGHTCRNTGGWGGRSPPQFGDILNLFWNFRRHFHLYISVWGILQTISEEACRKWLDKSKIHDNPLENLLTRV